MHSEGDDLPINKLSNTVEGKFKFGIEISDAMIDDVLKKTAGYKYYKAKKVESEKAKVVEETEEHNVSSVQSKRGKGYMNSGENEANVLKLFKKNDVPRKTRSLTVVEETVAAELAKSVKTSKEIANETNVADESDIDLIDDNPVRDDDAAGNAYLPRLGLNDLEDMYLLKVPDKMHHLPSEDEKDFNNAFLLFIRRTIIKNIVEDLQLGVESYQRTINLNKPKLYFEGINEKIPYKMTGTGKGFVYRNKYNERMVYLDNPLRSSDNVLNNQIFDTTSDDSYQSNVEMYLNDEEDDGDNLIIPQTLSKEIMTRIDNTKCPPSFIKEIGEDEI
nr:hypothetical protein [Tanacetum cinerariifolium]